MGRPDNPYIGCAFPETYIKAASDVGECCESGNLEKLIRLGRMEKAARPEFVTYSLAVLLPGTLAPLVELRNPAMQNADWIAMFRQLPAELHPQIMLVLANRAEISVESIFRLESTFVALRGRMGGTTDGGLLFLVPYDQLSSLYLTKEMKESELQTLLGAAQQAAVPVVAVQPSGASLPTSSIPSFGRPPEATSVARNNLLERLRAARNAAAPSINGK